MKNNTLPYKCRKAILGIAMLISIGWIGPLAVGLIILKHAYMIEIGKEAVCDLYGPQLGWQMIEIGAYWMIIAVFVLLSYGFTYVISGKWGYPIDEPSDNGERG